MSSLEKYINYPSNPMIKLYKKLKKNAQIDDCYGAQLYVG